MIKNLGDVDRYLTFQMERYRRLSLEYYKKVVWEVFGRILEQTPQFSGKAVGNWNLSVGAPDYTFDPYAGDIQQLTASGFVSQAGAHAKGDLIWIDYAYGKNLSKLESIQLDSKVYITNAAVGDTDHGRSSELYLESLQDPGYWAVKLRAANKPYETAAETIALFNLEKIAAGKVQPFL